MDFGGHIGLATARPMVFYTPYRLNSIPASMHVDMVAEERDNEIELSGVFLLCLSFHITLEAGKM